MTADQAQASTSSTPSTSIDSTGTRLERLRAAACWIIVGGFAFALFARTLRFGLYLDDHHHARPWGLREVLGTWHGVFDPLGIEPSYFRPMPVVTFAADWQLWGFTTWGYHLTNMILHTAVCLAVYALLRRTPISRWAAVAGAMFFAAIPANAATVVYISERSDAMVALFTLAGLLCVSRYRSTKRWPWLVGVDVCFVLSVASKEVGFAMLLLVVVWWAFLNYVEQPLPASDTGGQLSLGRHWLGEVTAIWRSIVAPFRLREFLLIVGPLMLLGATYLIYRAIVLPTGKVGVPYSDAGPIRGLLSGVYWSLKGVPWEVSGLAFPILAVATIVAFILRPRDRIWRVFVFGFAWIVAACIPLAPLGEIEPRLLYVAEIGLAVIVASVACILGHAVADAASRRARLRIVAIAAAGIVALVFIGATGVSTIRAQDQFEPGSAKMLHGDLVIWEDTAKRHLYEERYLEEIEADLRAAGLIDDDS